MHNMFKLGAFRRSWLAGAACVAVMHSAHADFVDIYVKRGFTAGASAQEHLPNCNPCGEDQEREIVKGPNNFQELYGYDSKTGDFGTRDLTSGNQSLSFQADYRGMHAAVSSERKVDFLSPDVIAVHVSGHLDVTHPGGEDLLRDKGLVRASGSAFTEFGFHVDRPTTVLVTVDMAFKDLIAPVGTLFGGLGGSITFTGDQLQKGYTTADLANGPVSFTTTLLPGAAHGVGVDFSVSGLRGAEAAAHSVSEWQGSVTIQAVPEPSGWALLSCGLLAGGWIIRRDRRIRRHHARGGLAAWTAARA